ncbi:uncharacterized protein SPAPADRAFT_147390 [Spathaspora passalidarum NRRL Y-27907]|uniref:CASTOR ACT domain-containing protein n=1 Tax=Spathaspora passalidarum (strain NRRL Y-27907 / 11-Y1) TaxID=619300 RepID=G3AET8_SPAPN|nr:uncharacterized protein SPAPADRAFT_147390 [Spathaspora passalidarum NRRL Y-27907]EGW35768.1 hypothetical protein SPAPADRAFT_147390 [Spathaspora passalidarum NRRL Y-27907]
MSTQVHLNPTKLSILSLPRDKYWIFACSILQLLYHESNKSGSGYSSDGDDEDEFSDDEDDSDIKDNGFEELKNGFSGAISSKRNSYDSIGEELNRLSVDNSSKVKSPDSATDLTHYEDESEHTEEQQEDEEEEGNFFFHIALTPDECTIVCSSKLMEAYFSNPIEICASLNYSVHLLPDSFLSLQVDSDGSFDRSLRILELTKPLSENGISLFFLSSHFNDIVLVPYDQKEKVVSILTKQNFEFNDISNSYIGSNDTESESTVHPEGSKLLEISTFKLFEQASIKPIINDNIKLLLTGARAGEVSNSILKTAKILSIPTTIPDYFAITRTSINEVSLILPKSSKRRIKMGFDSKFIIGSTQDVIIPITIDFSKLPLDSPGIVAGVASKLINGMRSLDNDCELNYFSMAKSGVIMIPRENVEMIATILE